MNYDIKQSGARIRQFRIKNGLTQEAIAAELNIDRSYYNRIEAGKKGCSIDLFIQLSELFHTSLDYLITGRCLLESADKAQMKENIENLVEHLQQFKNSF